jgi:hypothetical protein
MPTRAHTGIRTNTDKVRLSGARPSDGILNHLMIHADVRQTVALLHKADYCCVLPDHDKPVAPNSRKVHVAAVWPPNLSCRKRPFVQAHVKFAFHPKRTLTVGAQYHSWRRIFRPRRTRPIDF